MSDITTTWLVETGVGDWSIAGGALASGDDLASAVLISLFTDRVAGDDDVPPDGSDDRRGWWGDEGEDVSIGSHLWLLDRSRLSTDVANTARIYMEDALKWLIDDEVATAVTVATSIQGASRLDAIVLVTRRDGTTAQLRYNWAWNSSKINS